MKKVLFAVTLFAAASGFAAFSDDTIAFYPFNDYEASTSGGSKTFTNAVDASTFRATGLLWNHLNTYAKAVLECVDEAPGAYIFDDISGGCPMPIYANPKALWLSSKYEEGVEPTSDATPYARSGGEISFANIETELSGCSEFTIEFFWKIDTDEMDSRCQVQYDSAFLLNQQSTNWLTYAGNASIRKIGLAIPLVRTGVSGNDKVVALFDNLKPWGNYCTYPSTITHDEWHHIGLVFKDGKFGVYGDYQNYSAELKGQDSSETAGYALKKISDSVPFNFGHGRNGYAGFHGKVSCFRFSRKALDTSRFLRASDYPHYYDTRDPEPVAMGGETIAYYTFREGAGRIGESAKAMRILNDIDADTHYGTITTQATGGDVVFDDDRPAQYVFDSFKPGATACATNPYSLTFVRSTVDSSVYSADLKFADVATELSKSNERTIEFFYKLTDAAIVPEYQHNQALTFVAGITNNANGKAISMGLWLPCGSKGEEPKQVRISEKGVPANFYYQYIYANTLCDGKWHHVAISCVSTNYTLYLDYSQTGKAIVTNATPAALTSSEPLDFGLDYFAGKISCLRVSKKALAVDEMLHLSTLDTCKPADLFWYRFEDGTVGANVASKGAVNTPRLYSDYAPAIFHWAVENLPGDGYLKGTYYPSFADKTWWKSVMPTATEDERSNTKSIRLVTTPKASSGVTFASGPYIRSTTTPLKESMTMELFAKFDYAAFMEHIGDRFSETRDRVSIASHELGGMTYAWKLYFLDVTKKSAALRLDVTYEDGTSGVFSYVPSSPDVIRSRWHHYALVYDQENLKLMLYFDREKVIDQTLSQKLKFTGSTANPYYEFGSGGNNQPFDGWMDEIRLSEGVLGPEDFLRASGQPGMTFIIR